MRSLIRPLFAVLALALFAADASAGPIIERIRANRAERQGRQCQPSHQFAQPAPAAVNRQCVCGDSCPCPAGACPTKCPVTAAPAFVLPQAATGSSCPGGNCGIPSSSRGFFRR